jgi:hypothetical protein
LKKHTTLDKTYIIYPDTWMYELEYQAKNKKEALKEFMKDFGKQLSGEEDIYVRVK